MQKWIKTYRRRSVLRERRRPQSHHLLTVGVKGEKPLKNRYAKEEIKVFRWVAAQPVLHRPSHENPEGEDLKIYKTKQKHKKNRTQRNNSQNSLLCAAANNPNNKSKKPSTSLWERSEPKAGRKVDSFYLKDRGNLQLRQTTNKTWTNRGQKPQRKVNSLLKWERESSACISLAIEVIWLAW